MIKTPAFKYRGSRKGSKGHQPSLQSQGASWCPCLCMAHLARCLLPGWEGPLTLLKDPSLARRDHAQHQAQSYGPKYCEGALFCLDLVEDSVCACVCVCMCMHSFSTPVITNSENLPRMAQLCSGSQGFKLKSQSNVLVLYPQCSHSFSVSFSF